MNYDFGNKKQYRRTLWRFIDDQCDVPMLERRVVYLDTKQALETRFLIERGYNPQNLHAVNFNPAEVAVLSKVLKKDGIAVNTHGVPLNRAINIIKKQHGRIDVINADFCGCISDGLLADLKSITSGVDNRAIIAVTVLRGRERNFSNINYASNRSLQDVIDHCVCSHPKISDVGRIRAIMRVLINHDREMSVYAWRWGFYRSSAGNQTMMFMAAKVLQLNVTIMALRNHRRGDMRRRCEEALAAFEDKQTVKNWQALKHLRNLLKRDLKEDLDLLYDSISAEAVASNREDFLGRDRLKFGQASSEDEFKEERSALDDLLDDMEDEEAAQN